MPEIKSKFKSEKLTKQLRDIYSKLETRYGKIECPLIHRSPYELFVAVILSAQCTDKKVNTVTPRLFSAYPEVKDLAAADIKELEKLIHSIGLFRTKSANKIVNEFHSEIPDDMPSLLSLPGVGRKTANVILGNVFDIPGFPVDTHVIRLMNRIGIVETVIPEKIEKVVNCNLESRYWTDFSHLLITHGRACCRAAKPQCHECNLKCKSRSCSIS